MNKGIQAKLPTSLKAILFLFLILLGLIETVLLTRFIFLALHIPPEILNSDSLELSSKSILAVRLSTLVQNIFLFFLPVVILAYLCDLPTERGFFKPRKNRLFSWGLIPILWIVLNPFIAKIGLWNEAMHLPKGFYQLEEAIKASENQIDHIVEAMLKDKSLGSLCVNLFFIALIPAIGEEFFFRGGIQKFLVKIIPNPHIAILLGAILFSALHFQFYGFLPRMVLGLVLGYLFYWSESIWTGIFFHFLNNGVQILLSNLGFEKGGREFPDWLDHPGIVLTLASLILSIIILTGLNRSYKKSELHA